MVGSLRRRLLAGALVAALGVCVAAIVWLAVLMAAGDGASTVEAPPAQAGDGVDAAAVDAYVKRAVGRITDAGTVEALTRLKRMGARGRIELRLTIRPDGGIGELVQRTSSGNAEIDAATLALVRAAAPFEAYPQALRGAFQGIEIPLTFDFDRLAAGPG